MAYVVTIPRHLAPTVGPSASAAGVFIRTGLTITTGERVASGLIWRFGSLDCVSDNAGCFADRPFPAGGNVISFGGFDVYVATVAPPRYPREICAAQALLLEPAPASPPPAPASCRSPGKAEFPAHAGADPATIEKDLEAHRQLLLRQAEELAAAKRQLEINRREYDRAHGFTPGGDNPSRAGQIRRRGGGLGAEIARDGAESPAPSAEQPVYNTPDKNMRAAQPPRKS
ncbi:hypothetical protein QYE76_018039 [Lolium multiflorum]|uniref:Uncharacterized protein n=1 Tax=Lolium multiflorum TaxID=4521 RepID=A0AAD8PHL6_LOLMU|nr:hypothetical protein QYE76_018039 [Lolium multiflorum]